MLRIGTRDCRVVSRKSSSNKRYFCEMVWEWNKSGYEKSVMLENGLEPVEMWNARWTDDPINRPFKKYNHSIVLESLEIVGYPLLKRTVMWTHLYAFISLPLASCFWTEKSMLAWKQILHFPFMKLLRGVEPFWSGRGKLKRLDVWSTSPPSFMGTAYETRAVSACNDVTAEKADERMPLSCT